jgi:hypothetical protein
VARLEAEVESLRRQLDERKQADRAAAEQSSAQEQSLRADLAKAREAAMVAESKAVAAASEAQRHKVSCGCCTACASDMYRRADVGAAVHCVICPSSLVRAMTHKGMLVQYAIGDAWHQQYSCNWMLMAAHMLLLGNCDQSRT